MGVSALTAGSVKALSDNAGDNTFSLLDYGKERETYRIMVDGRQITADLINMRFSKKFYLRNNVARLLLEACALKLVPFSRVKRRLVARNFYLNHLYEADLVASIAGGDSFSDIYGLERFFYVTLPQLLALAMGKQLVLLPQTLGPFCGWLARAVARYILRRAVLVYSRDYAGLTEMRDFRKSNSDSGKLRFCYDVGFVVEAHRPETMDLDGLPERDRVAPVIGLNVSGLLYMGGYTQNNQFQLRTDYRLLVDRLISYLINEKQAMVLLVPHVFGEGENSESDSAVCEKLCRELKPKYGDKLHVVRGRYDQSEIKWIIGQCDFFLGSRMHACIAAISQCIPTVPIAYSKKFIGVMETVGMDPYVADPRTMDAEEILAVVDKTWSERDAIKAQLEKKMPEVRERVLNLFKEIAEELKI